MVTEAGITCHRSCEAMGTRFEVFLVGDDEAHLEAVAIAVLEEIVRLDGVLSRFDPRSEIARVNREAGVKPVCVDLEVFALLEQCERARQLTGGYFDITASTGGNGVELDAERRAVQFTRPDVVIDLGAIGKGYALDRGREVLLRFGVKRGLLQGGTSSVLAAGSPDDAERWPVDVRHPLAPDEPAIARVALADCGFSCSGARHPGQERSDVVNPLSGQPLDGNAACIALAPSAAEAEIFSTALLAMGYAQAARFLAKRPEPELKAGWFEPDMGFVWIEPAEGNHEWKSHAEHFWKPPGPP